MKKLTVFFLFLLLLLAAGARADVIIRNDEGMAKLVSQVEKAIADNLR